MSKIDWFHRQFWHCSVVYYITGRAINWLLCVWLVIITDWQSDWCSQSEKISTAINAWSEYPQLDEDVETDRYSPYNHCYRYKHRECERKAHLNRKAHDPTTTRHENRFREMAFFQIRKITEQRNTRIHAHNRRTRRVYSTQYTHISRVYILSIRCSCDRNAIWMCMRFACFCGLRLPV